MGNFFISFLLDNWQWVLLVIALVIIAALLPQKPHKGLYTYSLKGCVMTKAEVTCFKKLVSIIGNEYFVFPQVHLPTFLSHNNGSQNSWGAFRHIDEKSIDFLVCDKDKLSPMLAIELDDRSHEREDRQIRDREVQRIFDGAGIRLYRLEHGDIDGLSALQLKLGTSPVTTQTNI